MSKQEKNKQEQTFSSYADRLSYLLDIESVSMSKLSKITELPYGTVYNHVHGKKASMEDVVKIAAAMKASVNWLATGQGAMRVKPESQEEKSPTERFKETFIDVDTAGNLLGMILERLLKKENEYAVLHIRHYFTLLCLAATGVNNEVNEKIITDILNALEKKP